MATFVLIHGAGDTGWYWHLTEAELRARGHHTIAPDLPCDNGTASLDDYAATVAGAAAGRPDLVIVGQSYGAFTATLAASQLPARLLVLVAGMIPAPGESPSQWWAGTGYRKAVQEQAGLDGGKTGHDDPLISCYNGVPPSLAAEALRRGGRGESSVVWDTRWPLDAWPDVPTKVIACKDDRSFPAAFMRRVAEERLGTIPDEVPGCHCAALSHPRELSDLLVSYLALLKAPPDRAGSPSRLRRQPTRREVMSQRTARHEPRGKSEDQDVAGVHARRPVHKQGGKPRQPAGQPAGDGGMGPDEPDEAEFELIGDDDLGPADLGPAAPNVRDPDAGSGPIRK